MDRSAGEVDSATLVVGLLRQQGYPARWAEGQVILTPADWRSLTGLADGRQAGRFLAGHGREVQMAVGSNGEPNALVTRHVWVEAFVDGQWQVYDPSWALSAPSLPVGSFSFDLNKYLKGGAEAPPSTLLPAVAASTGERVHVPLALAEVGASYSSMPESWVGKLRVTLGEVSAEVDLSAVLSNNVVLTYRPALQKDVETAQAWSGLALTPAYLLDLRPAILIGDRLVAQGGPDSALSLAEPQTMTLDLIMGTSQEQVTRALTVGSTAVITLQVGRLDPVVARTRLQGQSQGLLSGQALMASNLRAIGLRFLADLQSEHEQITERSGLAVVQGPKVAVAAFDTGAVRVLGTPILGRLEAQTLDAARVVTQAVAPVEDQEKENAATLMLGVAASYAEAHVLDDIPGLPSESTLPLLGEAHRSAPVHFLCKGEEYQPEVESLYLSGEATAVFREALDQDLMVVTPQGQLSGEDVYILIDPKTGASRFALNEINGQAVEISFGVVGPDPLGEPVREPFQWGQDTRFQAEQAIAQAMVEQLQGVSSSPAPAEDDLAFTRQYVQQSVTDGSSEQFEAFFRGLNSGSSMALTAEVDETSSFVTPWHGILSYGRSSVEGRSAESFFREYGPALQVLVPVESDEVMEQAATLRTAPDAGVDQANEEYELGFLLGAASVSWARNAGEVVPEPDEGSEGDSGQEGGPEQPASTPLERLEQTREFFRTYGQGDCAYPNHFGCGRAVVDFTTWEYESSRLGQSPYWRTANGMLVQDMLNAEFAWENLQSDTGGTGGDLWLLFIKSPDTSTFWLAHSYSILVAHNSDEAQASLDGENEFEQAFVSSVVVPLALGVGPAAGLLNPDNYPPYMRVAIENLGRVKTKLARWINDPSSTGVGWFTKTLYPQRYPYP